MGRSAAWGLVCLVVGLLPAGPGRAHSSPDDCTEQNPCCFEPDCCSPHGAVLSQGGSVFSACVYDGSWYQRDFVCEPGLCPQVALGTCDVGWGTSWTDFFHSGLLFESPYLPPDDPSAPELYSSALVVPSVAVIWPPNGKFVPVELVQIAWPSFTVEIHPVSVTWDEDDPGAAYIDGDTVWVRARRDGGGDGRLYTIGYEATETQEGVPSFVRNYPHTCSDSVTVAVPHDVDDLGR